MFAFLLVTMAACLDGKGSFDVIPDFEINDQFEMDDNFFLTYPYDALIYKNKLYIAGGSYNIILLSHFKFIRTIGRRGEGPGEFRHPPVRVDLQGENIIVTEMFGWQCSTFTHEGTFVKKEKRSKRQWKSPNGSFLQLFPHDAMKSGYRIFNQVGNCYLGRVEGNDYMDFHLSKFLTVMGDDGIVYFIKKRGLIEVYDSFCDKLKDIEINIERLKKEIEFDPISTDLERSIGNNFDDYQFGIPIISAGLENNRFLWLLMRNENLENHDRAVVQSWVALVDAKTGDLISMEKLMWPANNLRVTDQYLIFISSFDSYVRGYKLNKIRRSLKSLN